MSQVVPSRRSQITIIALTILLSTIGFGICLPVLPVYAERYGATGWQNGLLVGVFSLCQFLLAPLWGKVSDRVGRRPVLIISVIGSAIGYFITGAAGGLAMLFAGRIIDGISGGNVAAAQAYIADITKPEERSKFMGMIGAAFGLGFILGPAMGGILSKQIGPGAPFHAAGILCLLNVLLIVWKLPESLTAEQRAHPHHEAPLRQLWQHCDGAVLKTTMLVYFTVTAAFSIMTQVYALMNMRKFGLDERQTGYILALIGFVGVIIQGGLLRRILPRVGEAPLAILGVLVLAVAFFLLPFAGAVASLIAVSALISVGNSFTQPTLNGLASRCAEAAWQGRALGLLQSAGSLGRFFGPFIGGTLLEMDKAGALAHYARTPLWAAAGLMVVSLLFSKGLKLPVTSDHPPVTPAPLSPDAADAPAEEA